MHKKPARLQTPYVKHSIPIFSTILKNNLETRELSLYLCCLQQVVQLLLEHNRLHFPKPIYKNV